MRARSRPRPQKPVTPANTSPAPTKAESQSMGVQTRPPRRPSSTREPAPICIWRKRRELCAARLGGQAFLLPAGKAAFHLPGLTGGQLFQKVAVVLGAAARVAGEDHGLVRHGAEILPADDRQGGDLRAFDAQGLHFIRFAYVHEPDLAGFQFPFDILGAHERKHDRLPYMPGPGPGSVPPSRCRHERTDYFLVLRSLACRTLFLLLLLFWTLLLAFAATCFS